MKGERQGTFKEQRATVDDKHRKFFEPLTQNKSTNFCQPTSGLAL